MVNNQNYMGQEHAEWGVIKHNRRIHLSPKQYDGEKATENCTFKCLHQFTICISCILGLVKDINGRYDVAFYIGGVGMLVGSMILFINNVVHYVNKKNNNSQVNKPGTLPKTIQISVIPADNLKS